MYYLNIFFLFSIFGYFFETIIRLIFKGIYENMLYGPWLPIYGLSAVLIIAINKYLKKKNYSKLKEKIIFFFTVSIGITLLELFIGNLMYYLTKQVFWDYSWAIFNLSKYISLEISLIWGFLALGINYYIYPKIKKYVVKIPKFITIALIFLILTDIIFKIINYI